MGERVVELVVLRRHCIPSADTPQEPELFEVTDVGQIPDERRLKPGDLLGQLLVGQRLQQILGPPSRALERYDEIRR